jgi:hypothetical protein
MPPPESVGLGVAFDELWPSTATVMSAFGAGEIDAVT